MSKGQGREIFIQSDWLRLLATFYKYNKFVTASEIKKNAIPKREMAILDFIGSHFTENLIIPELAEKFMVSEDYFYRLFKKTTGQTPIAYIQQLRISYAKQLLRTTEMTISDIGFSIGFDSTSYFSKTYKKLTGETPSHYRKSFF